MVHGFKGAAKKQEILNTKRQEIRKRVQDSISNRSLEKV